MLTLIRCPFDPLVTTVALKRPRPFCQKCRWQVTPKHAYTLDPMMSEWADYAAVQAQCGKLLGIEFTHNLSGNTQPQSSQQAESQWTDPGLRGGISECSLISTLKKNKKKTHRRRMICHKFSPNPCMRVKRHHHHHSSLVFSMCVVSSVCTKKRSKLTSVLYT